MADGATGKERFGGGQSWVFNKYDGIFEKDSRRSPVGRKTAWTFLESATRACVRVGVLARDQTDAAPGRMPRRVAQRLSAVKGLVR